MQKTSLVLALLLAGCAGNSAQRTVTPFHGDTIQLAPSQVEVINAMDNPFEDPSHVNLEERTAKAVEDWARETLMPGHTQGQFTFTIENVSFKRQGLEKATKGLEGFFTKDQEERIQATVQARLEFRDGHGDAVRTGALRAGKQMTFPEGLTLNKKEARVEEFIQGLVKDLDGRLREALSESLQGVTVSKL
ncbi:MAG: hypothetical protein C0514_03400 [Candidatus Puniceispirillum sp.]|nr:hypothetical protein [Candidatus Puniceispirillum sp.]